jgi:pentapeptide repeat protein
MKWLKARWSSARAWIWSFTKWGSLALIAAGVILTLWEVPKRQIRHLRQSDISRLEPKDRIQFEKDVVAAENSARVTMAQILGGFGLLVGLYLTYRNVKVSEEGKLTDRFSKAVELLGGEELNVRLGGIYALERIARDSQKDHWTVMEVLTAFVREQSTREYGRNIEGSIGSSIIPVDSDFRLREDIQAVLTVIGRRKWADRERLYQEINLMGSFLAGTVLLEANLRGANLFKTNLKRSILYKANLSNAVLAASILVRVDFSYANLSEAQLLDADLTGADLRTSIGLTWDQISEAKIDKTTMLPPELEERRKTEQAKKAAAPNQ